MSTAAVATVEVPQNPQPIVAICEHIKDNGRRCGTPAIRGRHFCYYHSRAHTPSPGIGARNYRPTLPETIESLQLIIRQVTEALGAQREVPIEPITEFDPDLGGVECVGGHAHSDEAGPVVERRHPGPIISGSCPP